MTAALDPSFSLEGKVAIITGGAGMLGTEFALALTAAGARVVLFDINASKLRTALARLRQQDRTPIEGVRVDITDEKRVSHAVRDVVRRHKKIDILVNNAALTDLAKGLARDAPYENFPVEVWKKEVATSLTGSFLCFKAVAPFMMRARSGVIVNVASTYGVVAPDNRIYRKGKYRSLAYAASKAGLLNFTRALASYLGPHGIRVNTLTPGGVLDRDRHDRRFRKAYSARTMLGRMAEKEELRGPILFLCSDASSYMTGSNLIVDGGWTAW